MVHQRHSPEDSTRHHKSPSLYHLKSHHSTPHPLRSVLDFMENLTISSHFIGQSWDVFFLAFKGGSPSLGATVLARLEHHPLTSLHTIMLPLAKAHHILTMSSYSFKEIKRAKTQDRKYENNNKELIYC